MSSSSGSALVARFLAGGAFNTAFGFAAILLLSAAGLAPAAANAGGFAIGLGVSFLVNRLFVFRGRGLFGAELGRYMAAFVAAYAVNLAVLEIILRFARWPAPVAQFLAVAVYALVMFVLCRTVVFRERR